MYSVEQANEALKAVGLRPTRQRLALLQLLLGKGNRHLTPEMLHVEAKANGIRVSLATVYNTLNQFTDCRILRRVIVDAGKSYFDTNTEPHHHFFDVRSEQLIDLPQASIRCEDLPTPPEGKSVESVDIIVRIG